MIDISHQQARRMLSTHFDRQLPEEQWTILQAHLETCPDCRAYGERLSRQEKSLNRVLRAGWQLVPGPEPDTPGRVVAYLQARSRNRKRGLIGATAVALLAAVFFLGGPAGIADRLKASRTGSQAAADASLATQAAGTPTPNALATVAAGDFPDVVAYEGRRDGQPNGNHEIYLINPGNQPVDLTNNSAQDTDPAWSPDGDWLAFLSDRNHKTEVYVTNITGSRVVQLSDEAHVSWQGPLDWSPDGKWLALTGIRDDQGGQRWIYLVALDGSGARPLPGSRGGESPRFAASDGRLAYTFSDGTYQGVAITNLDSGALSVTRWPVNPLVPDPAPGSAFGWSPDGSGLAFLTTDPNPVAEAGQPNADAPAPSGAAGSQIVAARSLSSPLSSFYDDTHDLQVASSRWPGAFRAVTWTPGGAVAYLEDLGDARANDKPSMMPQGCWTVQVGMASFRNVFNPSAPNGQGDSNNPGGLNDSHLASFGGLCVEGGLNSASWTPDGRWIVVQGRLPSETRLSVFALRMPDFFARGRFQIGRGQATPLPGATPAFPRRGTPGVNNDSFRSGLPSTAAPGTILRLANDPWVGALPSPRPRLASQAEPLNIDPQAVQLETKTPALSSSDMSQRLGGPQGQLVYTVQNNVMNVLVSANPDGMAGKVLMATQSQIRCPVWSAAKNEVALVQAAVSAPASSGAQNQAGGKSSSSPGDSGLADPGIYVIDSSGANLRTVTRQDDLPGGANTGVIDYGCPAWSPPKATGGPYVAALVTVGSQTYLAVLPTRPDTLIASLDGVQGTRPSDKGNVPVTGGAADTGLLPSPARYIAIDSQHGLNGAGGSASRYFLSSRPFWSPDGSKIFLLKTVTSGGKSQLTVVNVPDDPQAALSLAETPATFEGQSVIGLAAAPDGQALVELEVNSAVGSAHLHALHIPNSGGTAEMIGTAYLTQAQDAANDIQVQSGELTWLYGRTFGVVLHGGPLGRQKTVFYLYDVGENTTYRLAATEDVVTGFAWSNDGRWLVFSAESGLWGLDVTAALAGLAGPDWLSPQPVQDLSWR